MRVKPCLAELFLCLLVLGFESLTGRPGQLPREPRPRGSEGTIPSRALAFDRSGNPSRGQPSSKIAGTLWAATPHPLLSDIARRHSHDMIERHYFDHMNPELHTPDERVHHRMGDSISGAPYSGRTGASSYGRLNQRSGGKPLDASRRASLRKPQAISPVNSRRLAVQPGTP